MSNVENKSLVAPVIAIVCCQKSKEGYELQSVNQFYIDAVSDFGGVPVLLPSVLTIGNIEQMKGCFDGFLFPGSHSNVAPHRYSAPHIETYLDEGRDELALTLIQYAAENNIPALGICRGFQEMNVALGGTLHPFVHKVGFDDHRELNVDSFEEKYAPRHPVYVEQGGCFEKWLSALDYKEIRESIPVNTLHNQGINELSKNLNIEAKAPDGLIEAFSLPEHPYFVGVQWHPEWQAKTNIFSQVLFKRFIMAASKYKK